MEMMSQLPLPKPVASNNSPVKSTKSKNEDTAAAEVVSFPTLLQDNERTIASGTNQQPTEEQKPSADTPSVSGLNTKFEMVEAGGLAGSLGPVISENTGEVETVALGQSVSTGEITPETDLVSATGKPVLSTQAVTTESAVAQATAETTEVLPSEKTVTQVQDTVQTTEQTVAATSAIKAEAIAVESINNQTQVQGTAQSETQSDSKTVAQPTGQTVTQKVDQTVDQTVGQEIKSGGGAIQIPDGLKKDETASVKSGLDVQPKEPQQPLPTVENMTVEVVKEAPEAEQSNKPAVENPVLVRQASAELDLLSVQANAQKNYQQPAVSTDQGAIVKPTLADLNLDSGSLESKEQSQQSVARLLSSMNDSPSPLKRSIRGQVLNRVVEHLQEEIGKEKLTIRLNPEKLGQVEVLFQTQGDQLNITINSAGREAEMAIKEGARELSENIADRSQRWNLVEIRVENRNQEQQSKQDSRQDERREKQNKGEQQHQEGQRSHHDHNQETGAGEWAAFHLGG